MSGGGAVWREGVGVLVQRGLRNRIEECEISHLGYTGVSIGWEWGYAKPSGGGGTLVRDNFIHHIGRWELADMGGIYVLGDNPGTRIERNVIAHVSPYHVYGWGVYLDEGASGVVVEDNGASYARRRPPPPFWAQQLGGARVCVRRRRRRRPRLSIGEPPSSPFRATSCCAARRAPPPPP